MNKTEEKLKTLVTKSPASNWKEKVAFRKENKAWLKKSTRIALRVLDALDEKGWNQSDLARELGVTRQQISKLVKGESDFKLSSVSQLEKVLNIQLQVILLDNEEVMTEELFQERLNEEIIDYHRKWAYTQQYLKLKNKSTNPQVVMAIDAPVEKDFPMAG